MDLSSGMLICLVLCAFSFETTWCFIHSAESPVWPSGSYALPMADTGCPEGNGFTWFTGLRTEELENDQNKNKYSPNIHLMSKIETPDITRYFCVKNDTETDERRPKWPDGKYCIYKKGHFCPQGFHEGYVLWDDNNGERRSNRNSKHGELPEGLYDKDTMIYFCCKKTGSAMKRISLPVNKPFYLLAFESATCQEVQGAVYSLEYIVFDTENTDNHDAMVYPYPYDAARLKEPTIYYCHYQECKWNFTQPNGEFSSPYYPGNYHDYQDCQWNITAPRDHVIRLQFGVLELESNPHSCGDCRCSCDYVEVKEESVIGDVTVLGRYCMTPPAIIESSTNKLMVTFHSDHAISAKGFNASYTTIASSIKDRITTTARTISPTVKRMRSSRRGSTIGSTKRTTTQHPTSGNVRNNLTTTPGLLISAGSVNETEGTTTLGTERHSFTLIESSKQIQKTVQRSLIDARSTQGEQGPKGLTTVKPTNSKVKVTSTEVIHQYVGQSSGVLKPAPRSIMGLPLKYCLIITGSFVVVVLGVFCLAWKICKRRNRSSMKRVQQSIPSQLVTYSSVKESSGSTFPSSPMNMYEDSDLKKQFLEDQLVDNPTYHGSGDEKNYCKSQGTKKLKESVNLLYEASELADHCQLKLSDNPLYESAFLEATELSNQKESRTENPLYE